MQGRYIDPFHDLVHLFSIPLEDELLPGDSSVSVHSCAHSMHISTCAIHPAYISYTMGTECDVKYLIENRTKVQKLIIWIFFFKYKKIKKTPKKILLIFLFVGFLSAVSNQPVFVDGTELYQPCDR